MSNFGYNGMQNNPDVLVQPPMPSLPMVGKDEGATDAMCEADTASLQGVVPLGVKVTYGRSAGLTRNVQTNTDEYGAPEYTSSQGPDLIFTRYRAEDLADGGSVTMDVEMCSNGTFSVGEIVRTGTTSRNTRYVSGNAEAGLKPHVAVRAIGKSDLGAPVAYKLGYDGGANLTQLQINFDGGDGITYASEGSSDHPGVPVFWERVNGKIVNTMHGADADTALAAVVAKHKIDREFNSNAFQGAVVDRMMPQAQS